MAKWIINRGVSIPGIGNLEVEAEGYRIEGRLINFHDDGGRTVFSMLADTLATVERVET